MKINHDMAVRHAHALARNFQTAWPDASREQVADYVATHMVGNREQHVDGFLERAHGERDLATDYASWYANTIVNL